MKLQFVKFKSTVPAKNINPFPPVLAESLKVKFSKESTALTAEEVVSIAILPSVAIATPSLLSPTKFTDLVKDNAELSE